MKTLSLTQPWASLVALGEKRVETRSWQTSYRGELAIHASKGFAPWARERANEDVFCMALVHALMPAGNVPTVDLLPVGCVLATCRLVECIRTENVRLQNHSSLPAYVEQGILYVSPEEHEFGDYSPGRWAWLLEDVQALSEPVPARGSLQLWEWEPAV